MSQRGVYAGTHRPVVRVAWWSAEKRKGDIRGRMPRYDESNEAKNLALVEALWARDISELRMFAIDL